MGTTLRIEFKNMSTALPPVEKKLLTNPKGIEVSGWEIRSCSKPLLNSDDLEKWTDKIGLVALPEMVFGYSFVTLKHAESGFELSFNAYDALETVDKNNATVQVGYAEHWKQSKIASGEEDKLVQGKAFDWTYTTNYFGTVDEKKFQSVETEQRIDIERLKRHDPILFFDELILFEDELADNGSSMLTVKLRVMPTCFFLLCRLFIRVDDVMFRVLETRVYHQFGTTDVLREITHREATYEQLGGRLPTEKSKLNDPNFMIPLIPLRRQRIDKFELKKKSEEQEKNDDTNKESSVETNDNSKVDKDSTPPAAPSK